MSKVDYENLPNVDLIIFLKISKNVWKKFIASRGRILDSEDKFVNECFLLQKHMLNATIKYCNDFKKQFLVINQIFSSPKDMSKIVVEKLRDEKIINNI